MNKILKKLGKNISAILLGALFGLIISLMYTAWYWIPVKGPEIGLGIIAMAPVMFLLFGVMGLIAGAVLGLIIYQIINWYKKK